MSGEIPAELGNLSNLTRLYLFQNKLSGRYRRSWAASPTLNSWTISYNELSGEIPAELGSLSNLEYLALYLNELSGEIPAELGSLSNLTWLILAGNGLSGEIPAELGNLSNLDKAEPRQRNELSGEIPAELGSLSNLDKAAPRRQRVERGDTGGAGQPLQPGISGPLRDNELSGEIPAELGSLSNLILRCNLGENELSGCVPSSLKDQVRSYLTLATSPSAEATRPQPGTDSISPGRRSQRVLVMAHGAAEKRGISLSLPPASRLMAV